MRRAKARIARTFGGAVCLLLVVVVLVAACGSGGTASRPEHVQSSTPVTGPVPESVMSSAIDPASLYPRSIDQMIRVADAIVRASLLSATAGTESLIVEGGTSVYRPIQELRFTAHEYLVGSGSSVIRVIVRSRATYSTDTEALAVAERVTSQRNTTWDDRQAVLFLVTETRSWYPVSYTHLTLPTKRIV